MNERERLVAWLGDAFAMETELLPILRDHSNDAAALPGIRERIEEHAGETEQHVERLRQALGILGNSSPSLKSAVASIVGSIMAPGTAFFSDELVKNGVTDYAAEQFEVAAYRALVIAAEDLGEREVARLCRENLREDEAMAQWLLEQIPILVRETLADDMDRARG
ncbi:MAG TPA: DUF892 family protein [Vicinamibacterales bacterium]|nr:DUF892 family protein [Vicinamibacterales bacterium]